MAYMETCQGLAAGERILQFGCGGGMKAGINNWTVRAQTHVASAFF